MRALRRFLSRLHALFTRQQYERRLKEEFEEHLALLTEEKIRAGLSPAEAHRQARLKFGSVEALKDAYRDQRILPRIDALAIGAATAAFRLVDAVLLRTLPVAEPERLFYLTTIVGRDQFDYPTFRRYREIITDRADAMVVGIINRRDTVIGAADEPEKLYLQYVSSNLLTVFGLQPALGRLLTPDDDLTPGARFLEAFLFEVKATDIGIVVMPVIALTGVALLAALPPAMRAARIAPATRSSIAPPGCVRRVLLRHAPDIHWHGMPQADLPAASFPYAIP